MDHYRDLSAYTTTAAERVQTKAVADAGRLIVDYAIGTVWRELPADVQERLYGLLGEN